MSHITEIFPHSPLSLSLSENQSLDPLSCYRQHLLEEETQRSPTFSGMPSNANGFPFHSRGHRGCLPTNAPTFGSICPPPPPPPPSSVFLFVGSFAVGRWRAERG
ncbi:hypothetical protein BT93_F2214 [Corymbia citriodora subsp. variegata]|nr:hypothetical protein BT93_F2214 [Corymbia citriodora subsp. variegata]